MGKNVKTIEKTIDKTKTEEKPDAPEVITLPPFLLLIAIIAGIVLNWIFPLSFVFSYLGGVGFILLGLSIGCIIWSGKLFKEAGTNISPMEPTLVVIESGPYKYTRNPIYLCFLVGLFGLSLLDDAPMMMLMVIPLFFVLDRKVIKPEEKYLSDKFGDGYEEYKQRVKRWIY